MTEPNLTEWWHALVAASSDRDKAIQDAWQQLRDGKFISKVTVHTYRCPRCSGPPLVVVIRIGDNTLAHVRDIKLSRGKNNASSTPAARERNTLDGDRHWPSHVYDVGQLAPDGGFRVECRHVSKTVSAAEVLAITANVKPGHPGAPTVL
ncbi:hypothetical protein [Mycolicibacterium grossiae]|uniref:hypothetical protein n=1 Tax=Mycolicibacterium grossiae TaxID=1552759 RepID=UPI000F79DEC1|nr:hypothetical protein [Mycolicibacterium grossiae]QEM46089.1 hypothetical protein FZ046_16135 [Mycolicibacterium grossiae]